MFLMPEVWIKWQDAITK